MGSFLKKSAIQLKPVVEEIPIAVQPRDRPYSEEEMRLFKCALTLPIEYAEIISPIPGKLVYYFRNIENNAVIEILRMAIRRNIHTSDVDLEKSRKIIIDITDTYRQLDEGSRNRPDIFDHICLMKDINTFDVWDIFQKSVKNHSKEMTRIDIEVHTPAVVTAIAKDALKPGNNDAKALFARIAGLDKGNAAVVINDNSTHNTQVNATNQNIFSNFSSSVRKNEKQIVDAEKVEQKQLEEGKQDYIDAEYSDVNEKEKVA